MPQPWGGNTSSARLMSDPLFRPKRERFSRPCFRPINRNRNVSRVDVCLFVLVLKGGLHLGISYITRYDGRMALLLYTTSSSKFKEPPTSPMTWPLVSNSRNDPWDIILTESQPAGGLVRVMLSAASLYPQPTTTLFSSIAFQSEAELLTE